MTPLARGVAYARVWTAQQDLLTPGELADWLSERGFVPGVVEEGTDQAATNGTGLADARFALGHPGWRFVSLASTRGDGCTVYLATPTEEPLPNDTLAQYTVRRPALVYVILASGTSNSDRNLCENLAEAIMSATEGVAEVGGRGTKGNKPLVYNRHWLGEIKGGSVHKRNEARS